MIPARGGSKRIPRKNLKPFAGVPAIQRVIQSCDEAQVFDEIWVSTEDDQVAEVSAGLGTHVLPRPIELADDFTPTIPVVRHFVESRALHDSDTVACIYPTAVLLDSKTLGQAARDHLGATESRSFTFGALRFNSSPYRSFTYETEKGLEMLFPEFYEKRSQDLAPVMHDAGAFYFASSLTWRMSNRVFQQSSRPFLLEEAQAVDLDTLEDWSRAEIIHELREMQAAASD